MTCVEPTAGFGVWHSGTVPPFFLEEVSIFRTRFESVRGVAIGSYVYICCTDYEVIREKHQVLRKARYVSRGHDGIR